jgi:hypothetical protein
LPACVEPVQEVLNGVGDAVLHVGEAVHPLDRLRHLRHRVHVPSPTRFGKLLGDFSFSQYFDPFIAIGRKSC